MKIPALLALLPLAALCVLALAWVDVLPGAWTMRGWVEPHGQRRIRELAQRVGGHLDRWQAENEAAAPGAVVFLGSSTIARFPLAEAFPRATCLNRGIGDEPAWSLARRLTLSLPLAPPAGVVLYLGSVDLRAEAASPAQIAERAGRVLDAVATAAPGADVLVLGILPARGASPADVAALAAANRALATLVAERGATFLETNRPPLATVAGSLREDCSVDRLHLSPTGYEHLAARIRAEGGPVATLLAP